MDPAASPDAGDRMPPAPASESDPLQQLRGLLFQPEQVKLSALEKRLDDPVLHAEDVSRVLPEAVARAVQKDGRLSQAMSPVVETALKNSVRRNPAIITDAIFPVIGPAIRKALAEAFSRLVQSSNHALEHSLSWRGLRWRLEAWRTGRPFAEVVLRHTLVFRVEQVFLISQPDGLLLQHVTAPDVAASDQEVIAGMLTAIRCFVRDSFMSGGGGELESIHVGELDVWVETGPHAALAALIRGELPGEFRMSLRATLEGIHREEADLLQSFDGDSDSCLRLRPRLEECLQSRFADEDRKSPFSPQLLVVTGVLLVLLATWAAFRWREGTRWRNFLAALKAEPGIVVTEASRSGSAGHVAGLKDALATNPFVLAERAGLDTNKLSFRWEPYVALRPELLLSRAKRHLQPPPGVVLAVTDGVLEVRGMAPETWWRAAAPVAAGLPGIERIDASGLAWEASAPLAGATGQSRRLAGDLERVVIPFALGQSSASDQAKVLRSVATTIQRLGQLAGPATGGHMTVTVTGHADATGPPELNARLVRERANWVQDQLVAAGVPRELFAPVNSETLGTTPPPGIRRAVTFRVNGLP